MRRPRVIAHRGASAEAPENTLASFKKAIELEVDFIELDVHLSGDGIPVVIHDRTLVRTTNDRSGREVFDLTLGELKELDAGKWFHHAFEGEEIPTLEEVLKLDRKGIGLIIEIKATEKTRKKIPLAVLDVLRRAPKDRGPIYLGSFSSRVLITLINSDCPYPLQGLTSTQNVLNRHLRLELQSLSFSHFLLRKQIIIDYQQQGLFIATWTVDDPRLMRALIAKEVDGICTNEPRKLLEILSPLIAP